MKLVFCIDAVSICDAVCNNIGLTPSGAGLNSATEVWIEFSSAPSGDEKDQLKAQMLDKGYKFDREEA